MASTLSNEFSSSDTFEYILHKPTLLHQFQTYLTKSLAEENLIFLKSLREIKVLSTEHLDPISIRNDIKNLVEEFFLPSSPMELNIPSTIRNELLRAVEVMAIFEPASLGIFDETENHIMTVLSNRVRTFYYEIKNTSQNLIPAPKTSQKRVVVVGGGFCGLLVAKLLDKIPKFNVCLIDAKSFFEYTPLIVRAIPNAETKGLQLPHDEIIKNGNFVLGYVETVFADHIRLGNVEISFDYLVVSTGSSYASHIKADNVSSTYRLKKLQYEQQKLRNAQTVLVIGGGSVGIEIASEIACVFPSKHVTLIEANQYLLKRMTRKAHTRAFEYLQSLGVEVVLKERIIQYDEGRKLFKSQSGKCFKCDMVYLATGPHAQSTLLKKNFARYLDQSQRVNVLPSLQLPDHPNIFAGGDITNVREEKTAYSSLCSAITICRNICRMQEGKSTISQGEKGTKAPQEVPMLQIITLGTKDAMAILNNKHVFISNRWLKLKGTFKESTFRTLRGDDSPSPFLFGKPPKCPRGIEKLEVSPYLRDG